MALTANTSVLRRGDQTIPVEVEYPVAANAHLFTGSMVQVTNGFVAPATPGPGLVIGRCEEEADNSGGAAGAINAKIKQGIFAYENSIIAPCAAANRGMGCFAEDDDSVSLTNQGNTLPFAGIIYDVDADGVWIYQSLPQSLMIAAAGQAMTQPVHTVRGASTGNIANLAAFAVANDGIALVQDDLLLVKDQVAGAANGIYRVGVVAAGVAPLTRWDEYDSSDEVITGGVVIVAEGTAGADTAWQLTTNEPITVGVTALVYTQVPFGFGPAPADVAKQAAAAGTSQLGSRADHLHDISTAGPTNIAIGDMAAEGGSGSLARADHVHGMAAGVAPVNVDKSAANAGASGIVAREDHKHDISTASAGAITGIAAEGAAASLARSDHDHSYGVASLPAATVALPLAEGLGVPAVIRRPFAAGGGGAPDDVVIYAAATPFPFQILDTVLVVATAVGASTCTLRDTAGGGGAALSDTLSSAATGYVRNAALTATPTLAAGSTLTVRRSDNGVAGEIIITLQRA